MIKRIVNSRRFILDNVFNIFSIGLPIAVLQLFIYPSIEVAIGNDEYGFMLTIYSIWMIVSSYISGAIASSRVINNEKYVENKLSGDYLIIVKKWLIISTIISFFILFVYNTGNSFLHIFLQTIIAVFVFVEIYLECWFRITINYKLLFINKIILCVGYIMGYYVFCKTNYWELIFLFGYGFEIAHSLYLSNLFKEKKEKTKFYDSTNRDCKILIVPSVIDGLVSYADRLVLYPFLGGEEVSIYYISTLIGKTVNAAANSFKDVILSNIAKKQNNDKKLFAFSMIISTIIVVIVYFIILLISQPIIKFLYPNLVDSTIEYIPIVVLSSMIDTLICIAYPFVLNYCDTMWQIILSSISSMIYFVISIILLSKYGLIGFCYGILISQCIKLLLMIIVYIKKSKSKNSNKAEISIE